jgi:membrane protein DedA with SNARE-associated domain
MESLEALLVDGRQVEDLLTRPRGRRIVLGPPAPGRRRRRGCAAVGDSIGYELGRHFGRPWLFTHGPRVGLRHAVVHRLDDLFARHGGKTVLIARFVGILRALAPFVAGSSWMPYRRFLLFNLAGAVLWAVAFVSLGYVLGESWRVAEKWVGRAGLVGGAVILLAAIIWLRRRRVHRAR